MTHCRICGTQNHEIGKSIICESCADKKENKNPKNCICDQYTTCEECLNAVQNEGEKVLELLRLKYVKFLNHPCPELADKYDHCCDAEWCGLCTLDEVLAELRQKTGEQIPSRPQQEHQLNKDCLSCQHPTCPQRGTTSNAYFVCNDRQNQGRLTMNHKRCCETCLNVPCKILDRVLCINQGDQDKVLDEPERLKDCKNCHLPCSQTGKEISFYGKCPEFRFGNQTPSEGDLVVRESVKMFAVLMEAKLRKNDYKSHWSKESFTYLFGRLDEEMKELNQAVSSAKTDYERIADEAIDVANFLMMIVDNMEELRQAGEP